MNDNSMAIIILCSHLCVGEDVKPFEPAEWSKLADRLLKINLTPSDLLSLNKEGLKNHFSIHEIDRIIKLSNRSASISFELSKYAEQGIKIVTRADNEYPKMIKSRLGKNCPPLFYYIGDLSICNKKSIGFVGSRKIDEADIKFTKGIVLKVTKSGYAVVSGGAKGVDSISVETAIENNGYAIEYVADSLIRKAKMKNVIQAIRKNRLVILSLAKPDAGFNAGIAMGRNKFIYTQSEATLVVRSEYNKGGTWSGANESLKKDYCKVLCWDNNEYAGNKAIIKNGAIAINENWNCEIPLSDDTAEQLSLFN